MPAEYLALFVFLGLVMVLAGLFVAELAFRFLDRPVNPVPDERESSIEQRRRSAGE